MQKSADSDYSLRELQALLEQENVLLAETKARRAIEDPFFWFTECTKTKDEQADEKGLDPYRPFPDWPYIKYLLEALEHEKRIRIEKSRTMMATWVVSGYCAHRMFTRPATKVVFQSEDEARALVCVDYVKVLYEQSMEELKARWPVKAQSTEKLFMTNGSACIAISGDPDRIRSEHPTIVVLDEAAHITHGEKSYNNASATRCPKIIALSSAAPGWFEKINKSAVPIDWPEYGKKEQAVA